MGDAAEHPPRPLLPHRGMAIPWPPIQALFARGPNCSQALHQFLHSLLIVNHCTTAAFVVAAVQGLTLVPLSPQL